MPESELLLALPTGSSDLRKTLHQAMQQVRALGQNFVVDADLLSDLNSRLGAGRFHLAVLGQFKRGKSTLLNALLGEAVLPASVVPLTSVPTFILAGDALRGRVIHRNGQPGEEFTPHAGEEISTWLSRFVTEEGNPNNKLNVSYVEVFHPSPLLHGGIVLIDTPGIGSTFLHNTEATLNFLPQCDAALFVVSSDPPITAVEIDFLKRVQGQVARLDFVMNKIDYLAPPEREAGVRFLKSVLREKGGIKDMPSVYCVSARRGLEAAQSHDERAWVESGMENIRHELIEILSSKKSELLRHAIRTKALGILADVLMRLQLAISAAKMPFADLELRLEMLERQIEETQRERTVIGDLLKAEERRIIERLYARDEDIRERAMTELLPLLETFIATVERPMETAVRDALAEAIPPFFDRELSRISREVESEVEDALRHHRRRADELLETVRKNAADVFDLAYQPLPVMEDFLSHQPAYWKTHYWFSLHGPITPAMIDLLLPRKLRRARIRSRTLALAQTLVIRNVGGLRFRLQETVEETFRHFTRRIDARLKGTITATQGVVRSMLERRQQDADSVAMEVRQLEAATSSLAELHSSLREVH